MIQLLASVAKLCPSGKSNRPLAYFTPVTDALRIVEVWPCYETITDLTIFPLADTKNGNDSFRIAWAIFTLLNNAAKLTIAGEYHCSNIHFPSGRSGGPG